MTVPAAVYTAIAIHFARKCIRKCLMPQRTSANGIPLSIIRTHFPELFGDTPPVKPAGGMLIAKRYVDRTADRPSAGYSVASDSPGTLNIDWQMAAAALLAAKEHNLINFHA